MDTAAIKQLNARLGSVAITNEDRNTRCARYDNEIPDLKMGDASKRILIFDKFNGYGHGVATEAATVAIKTLASESGWGVAVTNKGGAFTPDILKEFNVVVWNNVSGDVLTLSQRTAFEEYMRQGGGFLGIHGSGGDFIYLWDWYVNELLGAQFIGHTMNPHYQDAKVVIENSSSGIGDGLPANWVMQDEWYSFRESPRDKDSDIVATVEESTYLPEMSGISLRMGDDHPIAWTRCVGKGRAFYSAIGHRPEVYQVEQNLALLKDALQWTAGAGKAGCAE
jgi:type 1 glutamine amidotransferase